jgi:hypothetical protein
MQHRKRLTRARRLDEIAVDPPPRGSILLSQGVRSLHPGSQAAEASVRVRGPMPQSLVVGRNDGELILDYPKPLETTRSIRSTLITSSLTSLRARGLFERYDALQTSAHRETILKCVAGEWLDLEVGRAHYEACDALGLSVEEQIAIGKDVSRRIHDTFLKLIVNMARSIGVTPWLLLPKGNVMQSRLYVGGGIRVSKLGPNSARVELARITLLGIPYVRHGLLGIYTAAVELLAKDVTARIVRTESFDPEQLLVLRLDWG